jgi:hypothetical protein
MMTRILCGIVLIAAAARAQNPPPSTAPTPPAAISAPQAAPSAPAQPATPPPAPVAPNDPVITIHGLCDKTADANSCTTVVTKEQYDSLLRSLTPPGQQPPPPTVQLAQQYVQLLAISDAAKKAGVENEPDYQDYLRLQEMRALAQRYRFDLQAQYSKPSDAEIQDYYHKHQYDYQEVKLRRVYIPNTSPSAQDKDAFKKKAEAAATDAHDRIARGEDPDQAEKEAYTALGLTSEPLKTDIGMQRRTTLPQELAVEIFALDPGGITKVNDEPSGYTMFKVDAKDTQPLDKVKPEIANLLARQDLDDKWNSITSSIHADYNNNFFTPPPPAALAPAQPKPAQPSPSPAPAPAPAPSKP